MNNSVCICIPKIEEKVTKQIIKDNFIKYKLGIIKKINVVYSKDKKNKLAFIYLKYINSENSQKIKTIIEDEKDFKLIYDFPFYWKCYKAKK